MPSEPPPDKSVHAAAPLRDTAARVVARPRPRGGAGSCCSSSPRRRRAPSGADADPEPVALALAVALTDALAIALAVALPNAEALPVSVGAELPVALPSALAVALAVVLAAADGVGAEESVGVAVALEADDELAVAVPVAEAENVGAAEAVGAADWEAETVAVSDAPAEALANGDAVADAVALAEALCVHAGPLKMPCTSMVEPSSCRKRGRPGERRPGAGREAAFTSCARATGPPAEQIRSSSIASRDVMVVWLASLKWPRLDGRSRGNATPRRWRLHRPPGPGDQSPPPRRHWVTTALPQPTLPGQHCRQQQQPAQPANL